MAMERPSIRYLQMRRRTTFLGWAESLTSTFISSSDARSSGLQTGSRCRVFRPEESHGAYTRGHFGGISILVNDNLVISYVKSTQDMEVGQWWPDWKASSDKQSKSVYHPSGKRLTPYRSNSIYRSAAALAALIHLNNLHHEYAYFVWSVHQVEPLFHLQTLASALDDSNTEKKFLATLITLACEGVHGRRCRERLTSVRIENLRRRLLGLLDSYRIQCLGNDPLCSFSVSCYLPILGGACILSNECFGYATQDCNSDDINDYKSLFEILYFTTVLFIHCIFSQYQQMKHEGMRLGHMVLSAHIFWIQAFPMDFIPHVFSLSRNISMLASAHDCVYVHLLQYRLVLYN